MLICCSCSNGSWTPSSFIMGDLYSFKMLWTEIVLQIQKVMVSYALDWGQAAGFESSLGASVGLCPKSQPVSLSPVAQCCTAPDHQRAIESTRKTLNQPSHRQMTVFPHHLIPPGSPVSPARGPWPVSLQSQSSVLPSFQKLLSF